MLVNSANLDALRAGFKTSYQQGVNTAKASTMWTRIANARPIFDQGTEIRLAGQVPASSRVDRNRAPFRT